MATVQRRTPGVYINEPDSFPPSIVGVGTAIPAFIGYTERANYKANDLTNVPTRITSMAEYSERFGGRFRETFYIATTITDGDRNVGKIVIGTTTYDVAESPNKQFNLYNSLRLFFANGGSECYIVSSGPYTTAAIKVKELESGLAAVKDVPGPTILAIPDAVLLPPDDPAVPIPPGDYNDIVKLMLAQCQDKQDRVALIDVWMDPRQTPQETVDSFRTGIGGVAQLARRYGMAYYPYIMTSVVQPGDLTVENLELTDATKLKDIQGALTAAAVQLYGADSDREKEAAHFIAMLNPTDKSDSDVAAPLKLSPRELTDALSSILPPFAELLGLLAQSQNAMPPSGAVAGVYAFTDANLGVWHAPANIGITEGVAPLYNLTNDQQQDFNVPINGLAVNAIRAFVGRGMLIWGARTLDGNSNDWRYIQVRRTMIYVEQSIKQALNQMVFAPNTAQTWVTTVSMVESFLHGLWSAGGLMGTAPAQAYTVLCGLGSTMTPDDVLNGYMKVSVILTMVHPAEFIELTFTQQMMGGS